MLRRLKLYDDKLYLERKQGHLMKDSISPLSRKPLQSSQSVHVTNYSTTVCQVPLATATHHCFNSVPINDFPSQGGHNFIE